MDNLEIHVMTPQDALEIEELLELYDSVGWRMYTRDLAVLVEGITGSSRVVTARVDGVLIGLARVITDGATICYLQDVLVTPAHQGKGVGRRLVEEAFAPYERVRQQVLITDEDQGQRAFYESLGFRIWGSEELPGHAFVRLA